MKLKSLIFLSLILLLIGNTFAQKTDPPKVVAPVAEKTPAPKLPGVTEILAKFVKAIGGREANEKIKTRVAKGTVEIPAAGIKGTVETFNAAPDKMLSTSNLAGIGDLIEGYDGKIGWGINPIQGSRDKTGQELAQAKFLANLHREINLEKLYPKIELKGVEKLGAAEVYVVTATPEGLPAETWYFDSKTGLLLRMDMTLITPEGNSPAKTYMEDYRELDGIMTPFKTRTVLPQFELVTTFTEVKHNVPVDDAKFAKPKQ